MGPLVSQLEVPVPWPLAVPVTRGSTLSDTTRAVRPSITTETSYSVYQPTETSLQLQLVTCQ